MTEFEGGSDQLLVSPALSIPRTELEVRVSRAGGPGGQHVNKTSTRVAVSWNVKSSSVLSLEQRAMIFSVLASKISESGDVRVVARDTRSQKQNWMLAEERLAEMIRKALTPRRARKKTRPTKSAVEKRLSSKKLLSAKKKERRNESDE
jgi:ribosome-associated protein